MEITNDIYNNKFLMISDIQIKSFVNNIFTKYDVDQSDYLFEDEIKFVIEDAFEIMGARKLAN